MKVIKSLKKLKFWSRKKRRNKFHFTDQLLQPPPTRPAPPPPPPPSSYCSFRSHYQPVLPSAPPLPPWLEFDQQYQETLLTSEVDSASASSDFSPPELIDAHDQKFPSAATTCSYQQYMVPNPVYDTPVLSETKKLERAGGAFGCVINIGVHLVKCIFPCFHIRESALH